MSDHSQLLSKTLAVLYPFILIIGLYLTFNGHISPGGGFQGGAVIAAIYISKYLILPIQDMHLGTIQSLEKVTLFFIILVPVFFLYLGANALYPMYHGLYLVGLNTLISLKVACGMTIIFFRFVYYEAR